MVGSRNIRTALVSSLTPLQTSCNIDILKGRTGRIGNIGLATSFYNERDADLAEALVKTMCETHQVIPDFLESFIPEGFTPDGHGDVATLKFEADSDFGDDAEESGEASGGGWGSTEPVAAVASGGWGADAPAHPPPATSGGWSAPAAAPTEQPASTGWGAPAAPVEREKFVVPVTPPQPPSSWGAQPEVQQPAPATSWGPPIPAPTPAVTSGGWGAQSKVQQPAPATSRGAPVPAAAPQPKLAPAWGSGW